MVDFLVKLVPLTRLGGSLLIQTIEDAINKDAQKQRGTKEFSLKPGAISKFYLTAEYRSSYLRKLKDMIDLNKLKFHHQDLQETRISRDEHDVQNLVVMLENNWINPFNIERQEFVSFQQGQLHRQRL